MPARPGPLRIACPQSFTTRRSNHGEAHHRIAAVTVKEAGSGKAGRLKIGLITSGRGSSSYYSDKVLENVATAKVYPAGTKMFLDHPGENEKYERP
ncbi:hypothetical protein GCM10009868_31200 [Terrabacter aerolatus]|uniref:Uncharacterized protein n=1 Tax=Terrabacter aerolatus TaxID=422442 RepID=A0A512CZ25_9MICO|nr:hypothetical protein TAE01_12470 [Terrabacter aerolatus]